MERICFYKGLSLKNKRAVNMDSLLLKERVIQGRKLYLAVVCDGVGSLEEGAYAAGAAVRMLNNWFENLEDTNGLDLRLQDYISNINLAVFTASKRMHIKTACTLSCLLLTENRYYVAYVGDSRIYLFQNAVAQQLTKDQVREGRLSNAIGYKEGLTVCYTEGNVTEGQRFLLCSDGLYKRMSPKFLNTSVQRANRWNMKRILHLLAKHVIERGEQDNISVALLIY